jgi:hypothetical protein
MMVISPIVRMKNETFGVPQVTKEIFFFYLDRIALITRNSFFTPMSSLIIQFTGKLRVIAT